eukprot:1954467-Rhodomonas_salina.1
MEGQVAELQALMDQARMKEEAEAKARKVAEMENERERALRAGQEAELARLRAALDSAKQALAAEKEKVKALEEAVAAAEAKEKALAGEQEKVASLNEALAKAKAGVNDAVKDSKGKLAAAEAEAAAGKETVKGLEGEKKALEQSLKEAEAKLAALEAKLKEMDGQIGELSEAAKAKEQSEVDTRKVGNPVSQPCGDILSPGCGDVASLERSEPACHSQGAAETERAQAQAREEAEAKARKVAEMENERERELRAAMEEEARSLREKLEGEQKKNLDLEEEVDKLQLKVQRRCAKKRVYPASAAERIGLQKITVVVQAQIPRVKPEGVTMQRSLPVPQTPETDLTPPEGEVRRRVIKPEGERKLGAKLTDFKTNSDVFASTSATAANTSSAFCGGLLPWLLFALSLLFCVCLLFYPSPQCYDGDWLGDGGTRVALAKSGLPTLHLLQASDDPACRNRATSQ